MRNPRINCTKLIAGVLCSSLLSACSSSDDESAETTPANPVPAATLYSISGSVSGLKGSLALQNNGDPTTTISLNGDTVISADIPEGTEYDIQVTSQPDNQYCEIKNGSGTVSASSSTVQIYCNDPYYFAANNSTDIVSPNIELWKTNGTAEGTQLVKDINPSGSSMELVTAMHQLNDRVYFSANDGSFGTELWRSDGTAEGTIRLTDLNQSGFGNSNPDTFILLNDQLLFNAFNDSEGFTVSHTLDSDENINVLSLTTMTDNYEINNNTLYFSNFSSNQLSNTLMTYNGVTIDEALFNSSHALDPDRFKVVNDSIFYLSVLSASETALRKVNLDGASSPETIRNFISVDSLNFVNDHIQQIASFDNKFFFNADDGFNGHTLWYSDGTEEGTRMLINPDGSSENSDASYLTVMQDKLFFVVEGTNVSGLWVTDGTIEGTSRLTTEEVITADFTGQSIPPVVANNQLFFRMRTDETGDELWVSDGTTEGTRLVKDIAIDTNSSGPTLLAPRNGYLLFAASSDETTGHELWRSDGTTEGTYMLKDICTADFCGSLEDTFLD